MTKPFIVNRILQGDCLDILPTLPEKSVDMIFADPPYNLQLQNQLYRPNMSKVDAVEDDWDKFGSLAEYDAFTRAWLSACRRVLKDTGTLWVIGSYHNIYRVGAILMDLGYWILNDIVWVKTNPMPNFRGVRFTNAHETLLWAQKKRGAKYTFHYESLKAYNDDLQMRSDWHLPICSGTERLRVGGEKVHSTQKPEALLYRVLLSSTQPDDVVLDPFFGTGTTGAVAQRLGRRWLGIERNSAYVEAAQARLAQTSVPLDPSYITPPPPKRAQKRLPFGDLVAGGYLQAGQTLYFQKKTDMQAVILADGRLRYGAVMGSIHQVGRAILGVPCNGWEHWYVHDEDKQTFLPLDVLRSRFRSAQNASDV